MSIYNGFDSKKGMAASFGEHVDDLEDCNIIYASYETEYYEGYAFVLFERNGKFYEVNGSHCSCYGLEDQWAPEETSFEALEHRVKKGNLRKSLGEHTNEVLEVLKSFNKAPVKTNHRFKLD